jgi:hypothetical protein
MLKRISSWFWKPFRSLTTFQHVVLAGILIFATIGIVQSVRKRILIDRTGERTIGAITRHERSGKSGTVTYYAYVVNGTRYETVSGDDKRFGDCIETGSCIGMKFVVEYATADPTKSRILWSEPR